MSVRVKFVDTEGGIYLADIIIGMSHGNNRSAFYKYRQLPNRCFKIVEDTVAFVFLTGEIINPCTFGQIDAVTDIIAFLIGFGCLIDRCYEKIRTVHILVTGSRTISIRIRIVQEHGTDQRHSVYRFLGKAISVRHQFGFQFQIHAVNGCSRFA